MLWLGYGYWSGGPYLSFFVSASSSSPSSTRGDFSEWVTDSVNFRLDRWTRGGQKEQDSVKSDYEHVAARVEDLEQANEQSGGRCRAGGKG